MKRLVYQGTSHALLTEHHEFVANFGKRKTFANNRTTGVML